MDRRIRERFATSPQVALTRMLWMHRVLLALSLVTIFAAVGGSHGLF